jgi:putative flippase GtrA
MLNKLLKKYKSLLLYGILGGIGALTDLSVYLILIRATSIQPSAATFISVSVGILVSFVLNSRLNFKKTDHYLLRFLTFYVVGVIGAFLSAFIILIFFNGLHWDARLAKIISIPPVVLTQFWINKRISFSDNPKLFWKMVFSFVKREWLPIIIFVFATAIFVLSAFNAITVDDMDNLLSGKLIVEGAVPYRDFFSHHTPGMYYLSAILYPFVSQSVFVYRLVFNIFLLVLLGSTYGVMRKYISKNVALIFVFLMSCAHSTALMQVPLAESFLAILIPLVLVLVYSVSKEKRLTIKKATLLSLLLFCIPFFSLGYAITAIPVYLYLAYILLFKLRIKGKALVSILAIALLPYIFLLLALALTGSLSEAHYNLFTFNQTYYAPMSGEGAHSLVGTFGHVIMLSFSQIGTVIRHIFDTTYVLRVVLVLSFLGAATGLYFHKKYAEGFLVLALLLLSNTRSNIFNQPAIASPLENISQHGAVYISIAIFMFALAICLFALKTKRKSLVYGINTALLILVSASFFYVSVKNISSAFSPNSKSNYHTYSQEVKNATLVNVANYIASYDDGVWIAPQGFAEQIFINAKNPTKYTFYFPWLDASPKIRAELFNELKADKPMVVYIDFTSYKPLQNIELKNIVQSSYFAVADHRLQNFYFLSSNQVNIKKELAHHGYKID